MIGPADVSELAAREPPDAITRADRPARRESENELTVDPNWRELIEHIDHTDFRRAERSPKEPAFVRVGQAVRRDEERGGPGGESAPRRSRA